MAGILADLASYYYTYYMPSGVASRVLCNLSIMTIPPNARVYVGQTNIAPIRPHDLQTVVMLTSPSPDPSAPP